MRTAPTTSLASTTWPRSCPSLARPPEALFDGVGRRPPVTGPVPVTVPRGGGSWGMQERWTGWWSSSVRGTIFRWRKRRSVGTPGDSLSRGISAPRSCDAHTAPSCWPRRGARTCRVRQGQHQLWLWLWRWSPVAGAWGQGLYGAHTSTLAVVLDV